MDSNQREIPITGDDMGEGFCDPIEAKENFLDKLQGEAWAREERLRKWEKGGLGGKKK